MSPQFKSLMKSVGMFSILSASALAVRFGSRFIVRAAPFCSDPCLSEASDVPCRPFEPKFEIKVVADPSGRAAVWYRASVKNVSCATIGSNGLFFARDLEESPLQNYQDSFVSVVDESGNRASESLSRPEGGPSGDLRVRAYRSEFRGQEVIAHAPRMEFIEVAPNDELNTSREVLSPYWIRVVDRRSSRGVASVPEREPVPRSEWDRRFVVPPEGFRRLTGYDLHHGVRYTARFVFNQDCFFRVDLNGRGRTKVAAMSILSLIAGEPAPARESRRQVRVESSSVEFTLSK